MPESVRLTPGVWTKVELGFMEREATPRLLMKLRIQLHLAGLSLSNTVPILEVFGLGRPRSTVHNWIRNAELQPETGQNSDQVAVDETVIHLDDEQYWLYVAVDPETNELLHTKLKPTRSNAFVHAFIHELREKRAVDDAVVFVDDATSLQATCRRHGLEFRYEKHGDRNSVERVLYEVK